MRHPWVLICPFSFITIHPLLDREVFDIVSWGFQTYNFNGERTPVFTFVWLLGLTFESFVIVAPINYNVLVVTCLSLHRYLHWRWNTFLMKIILKSVNILCICQNMTHVQYRYIFDKIQNNLIFDKYYTLKNKFWFCDHTIWFAKR